MSKSHGDLMSRKETIYQLGFAMSGTEFERTEGATEAVDGKSACVELVPIAATLRWESANPCVPRPDPCFLTQLIATAEQAPQTRTLRRATLADAEAAYRSVTDHNHATTAGIRTQQTS
jgi:hypothetical protein